MPGRSHSEEQKGCVRLLRGDVPSGPYFGGNYQEATGDACRWLSAQRLVERCRLFGAYPFTMSKSSKY
jgi:hypothetical protein